MRRLLLLAALTATAYVPANAQWEIQTSGTTASLRGIHALGNGIAWASGTEGTVLHTTDNGAHWLRCATPPDAEKLDFRGIQAFDANTAIIMSSGKGDLSRLYKTTDGCQTWKLVFTNPEKDGFWDAIKFRDKTYGVLLGDPVNGKFYARQTSNGGITWNRFGYEEALNTGSNTAGIFAASNSSIVFPEDPNVIFAIANQNGAAEFIEANFGELPCSYSSHESARRCPKDYGWGAFQGLPLQSFGESSGVFSIAVDWDWTGSDNHVIFVAVGGDYQKPNLSGTAARGFAYNDPSSEGSDAWKWQPATTPPHGYRSAVAYAAATKTWITVGPNGTDISTDDGRNWRALKPLPGQPDDADQHWNALSLPYVVGPRGRIGILNPAALKQTIPQK